jgi:hypothetical protein
MKTPTASTLFSSAQRLNDMPFSNSIIPSEKGPLSYLVSTPKALRILFSQKIQDARLQHLLAQLACILLSLIGFGVCGFFLVPTLLAVGAVAPCIFLFALSLSVGAGDLLLKFALEDQRFFEMATKTHALSVFEDNEQSLPQPQE